MDVRLIEIPKFEDHTGNVAVVESGIVPFDIKRIFYLYDIEGSATRGRHAHKELIQFLIPISGSFDVIVKNGINEEVFTLNDPAKGLLLNAGLWNELVNFSPGAVCMVVASDVYDEADYIRDFDDYLIYVKASK
ncbi:MAG: WxcM-like domain-containing protein [Flavobacterium sp.]|nr:MAG: WxcM-like domain-containing protein [Flavobacterium sp.]